MCISIVNTALAAAILFAVSDAAQVSKVRSTAFLSASVSVDAKNKASTGASSKQLSLLQETESQMNSDIAEVQKVLKVALLELQQWVQSEPAINRSHLKLEAVSTNSSKVHSKQQDKHEHATQTLSTKKTTEKHNASKLGNQTSIIAVHSASKEARVRQVAKTQEAILESLFKHLKSNIVNLNKQEGASKEAAAKSIQRLQARLKSDKAELQKKGLSQFEHDRLVNRTRTDTFELQYWTRDRSLGHQMFHTNLKMEHGLMSRVHQVIAACKDAALKGHMDPELMKKVQAQGVPKAFLEMRSNLKHQAQQYYAHVLTARWMAAEESESE